MVSYDDFSKMDLRVAEITSVRDHPNADRLLVLGVKVGDLNKQIVAGIKNSYNEEELIGKKIVIVNDLEPVRLRGEISEGMLLAASETNGAPVLIVPDKEIPDGSAIK